MKKQCILLDVFTDISFTGNQLAVFPSAGDINDSQMQKLANEINYSETVFILNSNDASADYCIRIFTPKAEVPFAGHPTLGCAYALLNVIDNALKGSKKISLKTKAGIIPLEADDEKIWMRQNSPEFFQTYKDRGVIAGLAGLEEGDIMKDLPVEEVSTGNNMLIVPVVNLRAIRKATGNYGRIVDFFKSNGSMAPYFFTLETEDPGCKIHSRFFAPHYGIMEDPATGSAAGPLTGYLLKHNVFGNEFEIINEQGIEMGRPSRIFMRGSLHGGEYKIEIGGTCRYMGKSEFELNNI